MWIFIHKFHIIVSHKKTTTTKNKQTKMHKIAWYHELHYYGVPKWTNSQIQYGDKKKCVVSQFWIVHMFSQFELCTCSFSLSWTHVFSNWENICANWENMHTTQTERKCAQNFHWENMCTQLKLREHNYVHNSNWENIIMYTIQTERTCAQFEIERQHIYFLLYLAFCSLWHPMHYL